MSCAANQGSGEASASAAVSAGSHHVERPGASARNATRKTQAVTMACAAITGQVVSPMCRGSMNRL